MLSTKSRQSCPTLCDPMDCRPPGSRPWDFPGKNTGVDCHILLQGILPTQRSNQHLLSPALAGSFLTTSAKGSPVSMVTLKIMLSGNMGNSPNAILFFEVSIHLYFCPFFCLQIASDNCDIYTCTHTHIHTYTESHT